jgi:RNA polymerase sigma-70 factor (ECF subfamily)
VALDRQEIDHLYRRHARDVTVFFARRTRDSEMAFDLTAETFAAALADREQFRGAGPDAGKAWIFGIAHNQLSAYRRRGAIERRALGRLHVEPRALTDGEIERIEELAGLNDLAEAVSGQLARLGPHYADALRLRVVEELSYQEVAATLGVSGTSARARVSRGLRSLAAALRDHPLLAEDLR